jgi:hypothetical protein
MDEYAQVVATWRPAVRRTQSRRPGDLLKLALKFVPGRHKTVRMPRLKESILKARTKFPGIYAELGD